MRKKELYRTLVDRYLNRTASPEELQVFFHLLEKGKLKKQLLAATQDEQDLALPGRLRRAPGRVRLLSGGVWHILRRYGAVAAVVIALVGGLLIWKIGSRRHEVPAFVSVYKNDIGPGRDKAALTLGDGSRVELNGVEEYNRLREEGKRHTPIYRLLATSAGGQYRLALPDGTTVWLNSQSSIRFPTVFEGKTRTVEVTGEAFFDVAKDVRRPFIVKAGKLIVQALGTQFNVRAYADEVGAKATLIQGSVRVIEGADSLVLVPGQEANETSGLLGNTVDTAQASAWKDGYFDFDNLDIQAIMRQFERWYDIRVVFATKPSAALFAGRLQRSLRLSQVMIGLGRMGVRSRLEGRTLIILP